jgi:hypothetical protein
LPNLFFISGRTPLIVDNSEDDKVATYYSYQPDAILLESTKMIVESTKKPLQDVLEYARVRLMSAMKYGKTLVIRMGSSAPDFSGSMCDEVLRFKSESDELCYFPMEVFTGGGAVLKTEGWPEKIFREEDMRPHKNIAYCRYEYLYLYKYTCIYVCMYNVNRYQYVEI